MKIVADQDIPNIREVLGAQVELILRPGREISTADVSGADALIVRSVTKVDEKLLADSSIQFVASVTAGADHIDAAYLESAQIPLVLASGFNAQAVADYVVAVVAALGQQSLLLGEKKRAAVVGVGQVGSRVVGHLTALGFEVITCDPLRAHEEGFVHTPLHELADVDLISVHTPLTVSGEFATYHMLNKAFFERQKRDAVLVNAGRGAVIHTEDLLEFGAHLHACLDVFENEPIVGRTLLDHVLVATPHIAGYSVQSKQRGLQLICEQMMDRGLLKAYVPHVLPVQSLDFANQSHYWQHVVLGVFNPMLLTILMRAQLAAAEDRAAVFDEMRRDFNFRYEFAYTELGQLKLADMDRQVLEALGFQFNRNGTA